MAPGCTNCALAWQSDRRPCSDTLLVHCLTVLMSSWMTRSMDFRQGSFSLMICFFTMASNAMSGVNRPVLKDIQIRHIDTRTENKIKNRRQGRHEQTRRCGKKLVRRGRKKRERTWSQGSHAADKPKVKNINLISRKVSFKAAILSMSKSVTDVLQ